MKTVTSRKNVIVVFCICLTCAGLFILLSHSDFVYKVIVSEKDRTACYAISDDEAKAMINRIFVTKVERSPNGLILFGTNPKNLFVSDIAKVNGNKGDGTYSTDVEYSDRETKKPLLKAAIFEDCDVQWIKVEQ